MTVQQFATHTRHGNATGHPIVQSVSELQSLNQ